MAVKLPLYLRNRLAALGIFDNNDVKTIGYLKVYRWLSYVCPGVSLKVLYDLFGIVAEVDSKFISHEMKMQIKQQYRNMLPNYFPLSEDLVRTYLSYAVSQAEIALKNNEVPVGAVVVKDSQIVGVGYNTTIEGNCVINHAEIIAIKNACEVTGNYRLNECDLYVTLEPCVMCAGAIINSRIKRLVFGAKEPKTGAVISSYNVFSNKGVNHCTEAIGPVDDVYYGKLVKDFFIAKRL